MSPTEAPTASVAPPAVVQLVARGLLDAYGSGTWKDLVGRGIAAAAAGVELRVEEFDPNDLPAAVAATPANCPAAVIEYSVHPGLVEALRRERPGTRVLVRAINAEGLQHWHRRAPGLRPTYDNACDWYGVTRLSWRDRRSARAAHATLGISEWDERHYWRRIAPRATFVPLPYFCPWPDLRPEVRPRPWRERDDLIVCMPGGGDRLSTQQQDNLGRLAAALAAVGDREVPRCGLTGGSRVWASTAPPTGDELSGAERLGRVDEPWDLLCGVKAVAVLTDLGFGMKTTVVDGLAAGCHVLIHAGLAPRLPAAVRERCLTIDPRAVDTAAILRTLAGPPDRHAEVHSALRRDAAQTFHAAVRGRYCRRPDGGTAEGGPSSNLTNPNDSVATGDETEG
ncbi:hypothetical protein [Alienimonas sp. DA493]|uniref:hypothetical protein n=1 Tax=Alienimonas sp. DA493 TaxID=3373605 RepID=UPI00375492F8